MSTTTRPRRMSIMDGAFVNMETRETPTHVAGLMTFRLPDDAGPDYFRDLVYRLRHPQALRKPFDLRLAKVRGRSLFPAVEPVDEIDMHYHVRITHLPTPGGERELGELVSHLHSTPLDPDRPLWTCHVIEGLNDGRFGIYFKIHHSLTDGVAAMHLITRALATEPGGDWLPPWEAGDRPADAFFLQHTGDTKAFSLLDTVRSVPGLFTRGLMPLFRERSSNPVRLPFEAPDCILNDPVTNARRIATAQMDLARVKALSKRAGVSINDVFLFVCSTITRRHLSNLGALPDRSLITGVPVSFRDANTSDASANNIGFMFVTLATDLDDPLKRLDAIRTSTHASKAHIDSVPRPVLSTYGLLVMLPPMAVLLSGQGARVKPPSMNLICSNVPGPQYPLYLGDAPLEGFHAVSVPMQGLGLNLTCISYNGQLNLTVTGSRDQLPQLQKLAVYVEDALAELEAAVDAA